MIVDALKKSILKEAFSTGFNNLQFEPKKFGELFNIINGFTPLRNDPTLWNNEINWFTVEDYNEQGYIINETKQHISKKALGSNSNRILPVGTVILCCTSATIGTSAICNVPMTTNQQFNGLVPLKDNDIDTKYLYYYTLTLKDKMKNDSTSTTFPFLSVKNLEKYDFPYIDINEQKTIANKIEELFLKLDEIEPVESELSTLKQAFANDMRKSILNFAFNGGLSSGNTDDWNSSAMIEKIDIYTGNSIPENVKKNKYSKVKDGYNYIATKDLSFSHNFDYENGVKIPYDEPSFKYAETNDILMCIEGGSAGRKIGILTEKVCFGNKLCKFGIKDDSILPKYLYYYLQSPNFLKNFYENLSGIIGGVSINKIKKIDIIYPSIEEQTRIINKIEELLPLCDDVEELVNN